MNIFHRKFSNKNYLNFLRNSPCIITGRAGQDIQPHHADVIGRQGIKNDYYAVPLCASKHTGSGHITRSKLEKQIKEDPRDIIIFLLSMYIEQLAGTYDQDMDKTINFLTWRRKMNGVE